MDTCSSNRFCCMHARLHRVQLIHLLSGLFIHHTVSRCALRALPPINPRHWPRTRSPPSSHRLPQQAKAPAAPHFRLLRNFQQNDAKNIKILMASSRTRIAIPSKSLLFWTRQTCLSTHNPAISPKSQYNVLQEPREMAMPAPATQTLSALLTRQPSAADSTRSNTAAGHTATCRSFRVPTARPAGLALRICVFMKFHLLKCSCTPLKCLPYL